jgi:hypothetical protein
MYKKGSRMDLSVKETDIATSFATMRKSLFRRQSWPSPELAQSNSTDCARLEGRRRKEEREFTVGLA